MFFRPQWFPFAMFFRLRRFFRFDVFSVSVVFRLRCSLKIVVPFLLSRFSHPLFFSFSSLLILIKFSRVLSSVVAVVWNHRMEPFGGWLACNSDEKARKLSGSFSRNFGKDRRPLVEFGKWFGKVWVLFSCSFFVLLVPFVRCSLHLLFPSFVVPFVCWCVLLLFSLFVVLFVPCSFRLLFSSFVVLFVCCSLCLLFSSFVVLFVFVLFVPCSFCLLVSSFVVLFVYCSFRVFGLVVLFVCCSLRSFLSCSFS